MPITTLLKKEDPKAAINTDGKTTTNPLQLKHGSLNNTHTVIQRVSNEELSKIAEDTDFKSADALRTFLNSNGITDEEIANAKADDIKFAIEAFLEASHKKEKKETKEEIKVKEKLENNAFRVNAELELYEKAFGKQFYEELMSLKESERWLDGGAGLGVAIHDYYRKGGKAKTTAVGYARPQASNEEQSRMVKELNEDKRFDYLSGMFFSEMNEEELKTDHKKINVISDYNGVLSYTKTLSEDLQKYLLILEVGGKIYTNFYATIKKNGTSISALAWLQASKGIKIEYKSNSLIIEKTEKDAVITPLKFVSQENIPENNIPQRIYEMSS